MKKIAVIFANGTEEIECLTPVDVLRRANVGVDLISVSGEYPQGSHQITIKADKLVEDVDFSVYDGIVIPGGMPGATNIAENSAVVSALKDLKKQGKLVASICASPAVVLKDKGVIKNEKATCYPAIDFVNTLGKNYTGNDLEIDGNVITANEPKSAMKFALAICEFLGVNPKF